MSDRAAAAHLSVMDPLLLAALILLAAAAAFAACSKAHTEWLMTRPANLERADGMPVALPPAPVFVDGYEVLQWG